MKLYNTLTRSKDEFLPIEGDTVKIYTCGLQYINMPILAICVHIFMDSLRRALSFNGYKLIHVMNITDVGHLK